VNAVERRAAEQLWQHLKIATTMMAAAPMESNPALAVAAAARRRMELAGSGSGLDGGCAHTENTAQYAQIWVKDQAAQQAAAARIWDCFHSGEVPLSSDLFDGAENYM
jgi:hypothetical protein